MVIREIAARINNALGFSSERGTRIISEWETRPLVKRLFAAGQLDRVEESFKNKPRFPYFRNRVLAPAVKRANERLAEAGGVPLPEHLTPHELRHTFASLLVALGVDPGSVMDQIGHTDPTFTLRVYRHGMRRDTGPGGVAEAGRAV